MKVAYFNTFDNFVELGLEPENMEDQAQLVHLGLGNSQLSVTVTCNVKNISAHLAGRRRHRAKHTSAIKPL